MDHIERKLTERLIWSLGVGFLGTWLALIAKWPPMSMMLFTLGFSALFTWGLWKKIDANFLTMFSVFLMTGVVGQALAMAVFFGLRL